jgi:hypothetical protein
MRYRIGTMAADLAGARKKKLRWCTNLHFEEYGKGVPPKDFHEIFTAFDELNGKRTGHEY